MSHLRLISSQSKAVSETMRLFLFVCASLAALGVPINHLYLDDVSAGMLKVMRPGLY